MYYFFVGKWWNGKIIAKTIWLTYVYSFPFKSCAEALVLIHKCVGCADSSYSHIQRLFVKLNSCVLTVMIAERSFSRFLVAYHIYLHSLYVLYGIKGLFWLDHIWCLLVSTDICHSVYDVYGLTILVCYSFTVCVLILAQIIPPVHVNHRYWNIYENIYFYCVYTR